MWRNKSLLPQSSPWPLPSLKPRNSARQFEHLPPSQRISQKSRLPAIKPRILYHFTITIPIIFISSHSHRIELNEYLFVSIPSQRQVNDDKAFHFIRLSDTMEWNYVVVLRDGTCSEWIKIEVFQHSLKFIRFSFYSPHIMLQLCIHSVITSTTQTLNSGLRWTQVEHLKSDWWNGIMHFSLGICASPLWINSE